MRTVVESRLGKGSSCLIIEDGAPSYAELLVERDRLLKINARLVSELSKKITSAVDHQDLWNCIEDVATGAKMECSRCKQPLPCTCDK